MMASKEDGTFYSQQQVMLTPGYWEFVIRFVGGAGTAGDMSYGSFVQKFLMDTSGFTVCESCARMIDTAAEQYNTYNLAAYFARASKNGPEPVYVVAGTVWERKVGGWPASIDRAFRKKRDQSDGAKPWWKFW
jgi:hypothetical protein